MYKGYNIEQCRKTNLCAKEKWTNKLIFFKKWCQSNPLISPTPPRMEWTSKEYVHLKTSCILIKSEKEIKVHRNYIKKFKKFVHIESERKKKIIEEYIQICKIFMKIKSKGKQNPWKEYTQTIKLKGIQDPCPIIIK